MRLLLLFGLMHLSWNVLWGQNSLPIRFKDIFFEKVTITKNISYQASVDADTKRKYYLLDLYQPTLDSSQNRPLIIWIHGGGFKFGTKKTRGTPLWSKTFAQRGFVCAAVNYRLSKKRPLARFTDLVDGCYEGIEDVQLAVTFLKKHAAEYKIDSNRIILAGNSAGGIISLQAVYVNLQELSKLALRADSNTASTQYNPMHIKAIISFWGAIFDPTSLQHTSVPIVSVHGSRDRVVPYNHKGPVYGSYAIHLKADSLHIPNSLKTFNDFGHELQKHFNPIFFGGKAKRNWLEAGQFAADFLFQQLFAAATKP